MNVPRTAKQIAAEVRNVQENVGLCEVSGFNRLEITGADRHKFLDRMFCGNVTMRPGRLGLGYLLNHHGMIKGEATPPTIARSIRFAIERKRNERSTAMLLRSELKNAERERLERALLATPSFRRDDFSWVTRYSAARTGVVSGDFLDGVELPDGTIRAVIGAT